MTRYGSSREVLDYVAFYELWTRLRLRSSTDKSFVVTILGYRWGREESARRHARRCRWFHQERRSQRSAQKT